MKIIAFKGCPKCKGDLVEDSDIHGKYIKCMQCGTYPSEDINYEPSDELKSEMNREFRLSHGGRFHNFTKY